MAEMLSVIENFIFEAKQNGKQSFAELYERLTAPQYHIGLRKGLIPIYLAAVIHVYKQKIIIYDSHGQVPISADTLAQINAKPEKFNLVYLDWNPERERYVQGLSVLFQEYVVDTEKISNSYDYVVSAMKRWYMALPKYAKESKITPKGVQISKIYQKVLKLLKQNVSGNELLFERLPKIFVSSEKLDELVHEINLVKNFYDSFIGNIKIELISLIKTIFVMEVYKDNIERMSLASVISDWCEALEPSVFEQLFTDGTDKCLNLFKTITNDDDATVSKLARIATDLRIEDWDEKTKVRFEKNILRFKETAESYRDTKTKEETVNDASVYQISFTDEAGAVITKRFERTESTKRGKLLHNQVTAALDSMGRSITDQEKRQILMEILKGLC